MAETTGLLNRRTGKLVPRVRIPLPPLEWAWQTAKIWDIAKPIIYFRDVAQSGSAPALGAGGPRFESWYPDIENQGVMIERLWLLFYLHAICMQIPVLYGLIWP